MTYEQLFLKVATYATTLPPQSLSLLVHLIANGIESGSNEVRVSSLALANELKCSRDTIRKAINALSGIIVIQAGDRVAFTFRMPPDWFSEQRNLFATRAAVEKLSNMPGIQATVCLESRQDQSEETAKGMPGIQAYGDQHAWEPGNNMPGNQARSAETCLDSRHEATQNQYFSAASAIDRIDSDVSVKRSITCVIDRIVKARVVEKHSREDALVLCGELYTYMQEFGGPHRNTKDPDEEILASCLAIAPLCELQPCLRKMHKDAIPCGDSYAWLRSTLANKIHGIRPPVLQQAYRLHKIKLNAIRRRSDEFGQDLVNQTAAKVRKLA